MASKMLVESDPHETRIAILENDRLTELYLERRNHRGSVGNVYKGRVNRVLPGMQAAFVDIGLERDAFLYVSDVIDEVPGRGDDEEIDESARAQVDEEPAEPAIEVSIDELLRPGQELLVQVTKDPLPNKGARVTTHVTLPGRYLVLLPTVAHLGVSRRIEDEAERDRLRGEIEAIAPATMGVIVRTAGEGKGEAEFSADLDYLAALWARIGERAAAGTAPVLVHRDLDLTLRVVRDLFSADFSVLWVAGEEAYERIVEFLSEVQPALLSRVKLDSDEASLFDRFAIDRDIEAALRPKAWLKSGGYIVINPTEALVAIDVNTGRYVGRHNLEETALATNLEAVGEIVRQIRLRDLGGILVIDFIDMVESDHRAEVFAALERELKRDRAKNKILAISEFGLVEVTRKRSHANLERLLTDPCPYCEGSGRVPSLPTICLNIRRAALSAGGKAGVATILLRVHPEVARALEAEERGILAEVERSTGVPVVVKTDSNLHRASFDILES